MLQRPVSGLGRQNQSLGPSLLPVLALVLALCASPASDPKHSCNW